MTKLPYAPQCSGRLTGVLSRTVLSLIGLLAATFYPAAAAAQAKVLDRAEDGDWKTKWIAVQVDGCTIVHFEEWNGMLSPFEKDRKLKWEGGCGANGLADGPGTLTFSGLYTSYGGGPDGPTKEQWNNTVVLKATFRNGLVEGAGTQTYYTDRTGKLVQTPQSPPFLNPERRVYRGGCRIDSTVGWSDCKTAFGAAFRDRVLAKMGSQAGAAAPAAKAVVPVPAPANVPALPTDAAALRGLAEAGNARAQFDLAKLLQGERNFTEAVRWYRLLAEGGDARAQTSLGHLFTNGQGVVKDLVEAVHWYRLAAEQNDAAGQTGLGYAYEKGNGIAKDFGQAVAWYGRAASQGFSIAQGNLGLMYEKGSGVAVDFVKAAEWYRRAADQNDAWSQNSLGLLYEHGNGVPLDLAQAVELYRRAADQGFVIAQTNLGFMYDTGRGVARDYARAAEWYRRAADQGQSRGQLNLGILYEQGRGVAQDYAQAGRLYRLSADQGNAIAQRRLGFLFEQGQGVTQSYTQAAQWYRLAADQGDALAQNNLGSLYFNGNGMPRDYAQAEQWFRRALQSDPNQQMAADNLKLVERVRADQRQVSDRRESEATGRLAAGALTAILGGNAQQVGQALAGKTVTPSAPARPTSSTPSSTSSAKAGGRVDQCLDRQTSQSHWTTVNGRRVYYQYVKNQCNFWIHVARVQKSGKVSPEEGLTPGMKLRAMPAETDTLMACSVRWDVIPGTGGNYECR